MSPTEKQQQRGTTAWATKQHKLFDRGRPFVMHLIFLKEMLACIPVFLVCFSFLYFLSALSIVFFRFAAKAGTKGDMSFLDAPDA